MSITRSPFNRREFKLVCGVSIALVVLQLHVMTKFLVQFTDQDTWTAIDPERRTTATTSSSNTIGDISADQEYEEWVQNKTQTYNATCPGWIDYKNWVEALFHLAPPAPDCHVVQQFVQAYNETRNAQGTLVLRRNAKQANEYGPLFHLFNPPESLRGRTREYAAMWEGANQKRSMPPNVEMLIYSNDKPRVPSDLGLPAFVISGEFPVGGGIPTRWVNYLPFPSHFYSFESPPDAASDFLARKPVVFFRGRFSENGWARFHTHPHEWNNTPRFKLALGSRHPEDQDVLDIKLTGFARGDEALQKEMRERLQQDYNITMGEITKNTTGNSRYGLAVSGNGWAGATAMRSLLSGSCTLFVNDTSIDYEGYTRDLGEIYFPLLKPDQDVVVVDYDNIAQAARTLNANPDKARDIAENGLRFAKRFLGMGCALDVIELLAWNYYKYVSKGCPTAFSHVQVDEFAPQVKS